MFVNAGNAIDLIISQGTGCFNLIQNQTGAPAQGAIGLHLKQDAGATVQQERFFDTLADAAAKVLADNNMAAFSNTPTLVEGAVSVVENATCQKP
ncbi:MAG: hypothetical protein J2P17_06425 [Mycobacterium sp.]|nr:hypothetical protein [Mycobacterium sp.]